jgi:peptidoglycan hydrolase-like protein with peptidoglycan-binding domain
MGVTRSGRYDAVTKAAVRKFQTAQGLTPSGNVNSATWRALLKDQAPSAG